ncbi:ABC transporter substrate-binding protein [Paenibacillus doosanensis]|uniref:Lipoprotein LipO n=1 Tax=Paenibacillus konkukensis TaxID=2020716 RepID=A0ABY4RIN4_9BACL|nr:MULTISPECIES: ABC transporter substrate-binding protein [Paenibacillus]MCS7461973.1 ABC transporter substrate-binding protein [Paenibacillus doosanensis]UQZ81484.1 Lipoprotein LipO precursor [Paenibacillus konkukensis]
MRKTALIALSFMLSTGVLLSACSDKGDAGADQGGGGGTAKAAVSEPGQLPITAEKTTIKVLMKGSASVEDFATNEFTKWLEEKTNIHIEWEVAPEKSATEKLNLVLSSGDYPDVIMGFGVSPTQMMIYGSQGVFLPLNDLIEKYGVEMKKMFQANPFYKDLITAPDGNVYALPQVNECYHCMYQQRMWIQKPWLDKLGLQMPTTTDEFYEVLKAFKTKDPNGNGKADEIPLSGSIQASSSNLFSTQMLDSFLMNAFIYDHGEKKLYLDNGKVAVPYNKPEWKEGLKYLHKLYAEGLIDPQALTQDNNQLKKLGENPDTVILGASSGHNMGSLTTLGASSGRWLTYVAVPPLKGPNGFQNAAYHPYVVSNGQYVITKNAKNPEAAFRLADFLFNSPDTVIRWYAGREGVEWRYAEKSEIGINGKPAIWKQLTPWGGVQNVNWGQTGPSYRSNDFRLGEVANPEQPLEVILYNETKTKMEPYQMNIDKVMPPVFFTADQASEVADLEKTILDHVKEMMARFITGDSDIDKNWDAYLKNLENMNIKRYLEIYQTAYDANFKKK